MDGLQAARKLEALRRSMLRVEHRRPADAKALLDDDDRRDAISLGLIRATTSAADIAAMVIAELDLPPPRTAPEAFDRLQEAGWIEAGLAQTMKEMATFRDMAISDPDAIDWEAVHGLLHEHLNDFRAFGRKIGHRLDPAIAP